MNDIRKAVFNQRLCRARVVVENTIGILKKRFPVLRTGISLKDRELWSDLILVCGALHNMILGFIQ